MHAAIMVEKISKEYRLFNYKRNKLMELMRNKKKRTIIRALNNISFSLNPGECMGLMGFNGSGKSTLANIIAGIVIPTYGQIQVNGKAACISVNAGLSRDLTGVENIEYKGLLLGFTPREMKEVAPSIIEFADIGDYIFQPVKYYSSGMVARLGFAISININPDILIVDEGLSVGDSSFTDKCISAMNEFRSNGKTIVFVSHSPSMIKSFCTKAMWLEYGHARLFGKCNYVANEYIKFLNRYKKMTKDEKEAYRIQAQAGGEKS